MDVKVNGITLSGVNYKESDRILNVFTLERGKITVSARGVRKANAKMKAAAEPFCFAEMVLSEKAGRYTLREFNAFNTFYPLRLDLKKYYAGSCALEFVNAFFPEETVSEEMFALLADYLKKLLESDAPKKLLAEFLMRALEISGYALTLSFCPKCGNEIKDRVFFSSDGAVVCSDCRKSGDREFSYSTYAYLRRIFDGEEREDALDDLNNGLRFFAYYLSRATGVTLKCIPPLIDAV